jgi:hypothetical protein
MEGVPDDFVLPEPASEEMASFKVGLKQGIAAANTGVREDMVDVTRVEMLQTRRKLEVGSGKIVVDFTITRVVPKEQEVAFVASVEATLQESVSSGSMLEEIKKAAEQLPVEVNLNADAFVVEQTESVPDPHGCCEAYTAECLSCAAGVSEEEFCEDEDSKDIAGCLSFFDKAVTKVGDLTLTEIAIICGSIFSVGVLGFCLSCYCWCKGNSVGVGGSSSDWKNNDKLSLTGFGDEL